MKALAVTFLATTIICGLGWLKGHVSCMALIYYMEKKGYAPPNDKEMKECADEAVKHLLM